MRDTILRLNKRLVDRGQRLADVSIEELRDLIDDVRE
jgi:hypothetical protein